jgi:hypothetical protein
MISNGEVINNKVKNCFEYYNCDIKFVITSLSFEKL